MDRRNFLKRAGSGLAAVSLDGLVRAAQPATDEAIVKPKGPPFGGLKIGVASYSLRHFSLDQAIAATRQLGVEYLALKDVHLPLNSPPQAIRDAKTKIADAGLKISGAGVVYLASGKPDEMKRAIAYVQALSAPVLIAGIAPAHLPVLDRVVRASEILVAIHNHGPGDKLFPSPLDAFHAAQNYDRRIGVCMDIGHTFRCGIDPAAAARVCASRLYDLHLKDLDRPAARARTVPMGVGAIDLPRLFDTLQELKFAHVAALEYEAEEANPFRGMGESIGWIRGYLSRAPRNDRPA